MIKHVSKAALTAAVAAMALSSCTVSEPELPSGDASSMQLTAITVGGATIMAVDYDTQNRITKINYYNDFTIEISYGASTSTAPEQVVVTDYEDYWDGDDTVTHLPSEQETWTNIRTNADGYITYYDCSDISWREVYDPETQTNRREPYEQKSTESYTYDADGHMTQNVLHDFDDFGNPQKLITTYTWKDGLLLSYADDDTDHNERAEFHYSDVENVHGQWEPHTHLSALMITGLFGKAPAKFLKSETYYYQGIESETTQYSYALTDNGLIKYAKLLEQGEDMAIVMNYVYKTKK